MVHGRGSDEIGIDLDLDFEIALAIVVYHNFVVRLQASAMTSEHILFMRVHYFGLVIYSGSAAEQVRDSFQFKRQIRHIYTPEMHVQHHATSRMQENYQYPD